MNRHGSLFSGIGGFDLAAEWMGWENVFHCEQDAFCQRVLNHYWPKATLYPNIKTFDAKQYEGKIDVLTGGFPCQPFSAAGKRLGTEDDRHLWPEMLRVIREIKPTWIVGENVGGLLTWNEGMVFEEVHADLEAEGYEVQAFVLPACAKDAPHRRDRVWIVAHSNGAGLQAQGAKQQTTGAARGGIQRPASNADSCQRLERRLYKDESKKTERHLSAFSPWNSRNAWQNFPTVSPIHSRDDGFSDKLDGITLSAWRNNSIKAAGNAIVPQVVYEIFKAIEAIQNQNE